EIRGQYAESIKPSSLLDPGTLRYIRESAIAIVVVQNVGITCQPRRSAGDHDSLVEARSRFRDRGGSQIETDVVGDEQVEMAVAVIVQKCATGSPACFLPDYPGFFADVSKSSITVIVVKHIPAVVGDVQIFPAVV